MDITKKRILVIEDIDSLRESLVDLLETSNFNVSSAGNLDEAFELIEKRTFDVALIDIMLQGEEDLANQDGLKIMGKLNKKNEGTVLIAVTGQHQPHIVRDILKRYNAYDYIDKKNYSNKLLLDTINQGLLNAKLNLYSGYDNLFELLSNENSDLWVSKALGVLRPSDGAMGLSTFFFSFFKQLLPAILGNKEVEIANLVGNKFIYGEFWSKGIGQKIIYVISNSKVDFTEINDLLTINFDELDSIWTFKQNRLIGRVFIKS